MGDILHALPAATALRRAHPEWTIGWAVEPRWQSLLRAGAETSERNAAMPLVDRVHWIDPKRWGRQPLHPATLRDFGRVWRELRAEKYDICVDLQGAARSAILGRWAGAARMIGEDNPRERAARWFFGERARTTGRHVIEQAVEVLETVAGDKLSAMPPLLPRDAAAAAWVEGFLSSGVRSPFAIVNPGAGWGAKRWPAERYGFVAKALAERGLGVVANLGPGEVELGEQLVAASGGTAFAAQPTLGQLIELTRRSSLFIAGDTGPLHLACALGKPVVGVFGPTDPSRNGPFGCDFRVLRNPESKRDHTRRSEPEAGLLTIAPAAVVAAAEELLKERG